MLQTEGTAVWARKGSKASAGSILPGLDRRAAAPMSFSVESDAHVWIDTSTEQRCRAGRLDLDLAKRCPAPAQIA